MTKPLFKPRRIFCAPPHHYNVVRGDNAHQHKGHAKFHADPEGNRDRLMTAWKKVTDELTRLGHELLIPDLDPQAPDQVFAADGVFHFIDEQGRRCALLSHMNSPARQREVDAAERLFTKLGYVIYSPDKNYKHEGTGDGLYAQDIKAIFTGHGPRTDREAGQYLADVTGRTVFALPLMNNCMNDRYDAVNGGLRSKDVEGFHLDVLAQPLPTSHLICYWEGLPRLTQQALGLFYNNVFDEEQRKFHSRLIKVSRDDYNKFATNCVAVPDKEASNGHALFIPQDISQALKDTLSGIGYRLLGVDIDVARMSGGGLHCMFNVENDLSSPPSRKLNDVEEFLIHEWTERTRLDAARPRPRSAPAFDVFRPRSPMRDRGAVNDNPQP